MNFLGECPAPVLSSSICQKPLQVRYDKVWIIKYNIGKELEETELFHLKVHEVVNILFFSHSINPYTSLVPDINK